MKPDELAELQANSQAFLAAHRAMTAACGEWKGSLATKIAELYRNREAYELCLEFVLMYQTAYRTGDSTAEEKSLAKRLGTETDWRHIVEAILAKFNDPRENQEKIHESLENARKNGHCPLSESTERIIKGLQRFDSFCENLSAEEIRPHVNSWKEWRAAIARNDPPGGRRED